MNWKRALRVQRPAARQAAEDIDAEFEFHLEARTEELVAAGLDREEAARQARREFGDMKAARAALVPRARRSERTRRVTRHLDELARDAREAARGLRADPAFTLVAVATLALAIGVNTGIFSIANAVMFRPLPYLEPDRIVSVHETEVGVHERNHISTATFIDWRNEGTSFTSFGGYSFEAGLATSDRDGRPRQVRSVAMTPSAFGILGVPPALGRTFTADEGVPGAPGLAILSWGFWQSRYGGDDAVIGRTISMDGVEYEIVGVMGPRFRFPNATVEVWRNLRFAAASEGQNRGAHQWRGLGRLAPGVTPERADAELDAISARLESSFPVEMTGWRARVVPLQEDLTRAVRPLLWVLLSVVVAVLLVACANLANLVLARFAARSRELAVRSALGAGRGRLIRRGLVESGLLAVAGGALGVVAGLALVRALVSAAPPDIPRLEEVGLDPTVLAFAALVTVASTALFGLVPAARASGVDPAAALRDGRRGSGGGPARSRLRAGILVSQVALSSLLLIGAGLLVRTMIELHQVDYGFEPAGLLAVSVNLPSSGYPGFEEQMAFYEPLLERVRALPGVEAATSTTEPPVVGFQMTWGYVVEGRPRPGPDPFHDAVELRVVTPDYFETVRQPVLAGRTLDERDAPGAPATAVINRALADLRWPGEDPIGQRISFEGPEGPWMEIVGVVGDTRHVGAERETPAVYQSFAQKTWDWMSWQTLMVRAEGDPAALAAPVQQAIWSLDGSLPVERVVEVEALYADDRAANRFATQLLVAFAGIAVLLGAIGLYGVLAYAVAQRRREIGVRMALGAPRPGIATMVVRDGLRLCALGLAIGLAAAVVGTRFLESLLYGVGTRDPLTFIAIPLLLLVVAIAASWLPARRAAATDPALVLRDG